MNGKRLEIFRVFGFPIRIDLSWLLILFLVTYSLAAGYFPTNHPGLPVSAYWAMGFVAAIGLFASILFHELSHSLVARHFKIKIDGITLFIFGGVAEMREESPSPKVEFWVAVMGPAASLALAFLFFRLSHFLENQEMNRAFILILYYLGFMNALLGLFNLVPAFPLDGGRIFRSILWAIKKDYLKATKISAKIGEGFGWLLVAFGVLAFFRGSPLAGIWYVLIGFFLRRASQLSVQQVLIQDRLQTLPLSQVMDREFVSLHPADRMVDAITRLEEFSLQSHYPVLSEGKLVGTLPLEKLKQLKERGWEYLRVEDLLDPDWSSHTVDVHRDAWEAFRKMREGQLSNLFVMEEGRFSGWVTMEKLLRLASLVESGKGL